MKKSYLIIALVAMCCSACSGGKGGETQSAVATEVKNADGSISVESQTSKKPTIMIVPSDKWCLDNRYTTLFADEEGTEVRISDYTKAFLHDQDLPGVISNMGQKLTDLGYSLKDCQQELKKIDTKNAEDNVTTSSTSGASLKESPLDILKRKTKCDIILQIGWILRSEMGGRSIEFTIEAFDAYTSKRIATATGISEPSTEIIARMAAAAVEERIPAFDAQMMEWYKDLNVNGREIALNVRVWDNSDVNLETENDEGEEFIDIIQNWMKKNTVKGAFNYTDGSENFAQFEQVRIPLFDENGDAMDARAFATALRKYLKKEYDVTSKVMVRGLGEAILVIGEK